MKQVFILSMLIFGMNQVIAQSVGIGTTTPNSKALLDISSTTKGILIPRMTTSQRLAIATPPNGLLVYDTDKDEFHQYNGSGWRAILNSEYWSRPITSRSKISNLNDSVGIGLSLPAELLDVAGNIRTNGDLIIDNSSAILQLRSSAVNKCFVQLSGDNLRLGTFSGNTTGNVVVRLNGNDRVTISPAGNIDLDGKITRSAETGNASLLPVCFGQIAGSGGIINGTGNFTVVKTGDGIYEISCSLFTSTSVIIATPNQLPSAFGAGYLSPGKLVVFSSSPSTTFQFVVYNLN
jgi:hypothetical protein